ncbi:hypothetical protein JTB14_033181 [Gonioctena quinquepunctata]|nr:hypothetical protein JTB14_033181 [Gonioctena quinquepunctata]
MKELFPNKPDTWLRMEGAFPFTMEKLDPACSELKAGKAPGLDGILAETTKVAVEVASTVILEIMNYLLARQICLPQWKRACVALGQEEVGATSGNEHRRKDKPRTAASRSREDDGYGPPPLLLDKNITNEIVELKNIISKQTQKMADIHTAIHSLTQIVHQLVTLLRSGAAQNVRQGRLPPPTPPHGSWCAPA